MIGQSSPLSPTVAFADQFKALERRIADLERREATRQAIAGDVTTAVTNASGQVTVTHGLPFAPTSVVASPDSSNHSQHRVDNVNAVSFRYTAISAAGSPVASASVSFQWIAFREAT